MMKKLLLILSALVPVLAGCVVNFTLRFPVIGPLLFQVVPFLTTVFWVFLGWQYARARWKALPAVLTANSLGIVSLAVYLWQFLSSTDETRNLALAGASQMFSAATPSWLLGRFAILFESQPNYVGRSAMLALQVLALAYMVLIFVCGYTAEKVIHKTSSFG